MTNDDFKKLLNESIKPLKEDLDEVKEELKEVKNTQEQRVLPPLVYIETTVKSYADLIRTKARLVMFYESFVANQFFVIP